MNATSANLLVILRLFVRIFEHNGFAVNVFFHQRLAEAQGGSSNADQADFLVTVDPLRLIHPTEQLFSLCPGA